MTGAALGRVWQEVEFGSYGADLPLWVELAEAAEARCSSSAREQGASRCTSPDTATT